ncbi:hypothetical protein FJ366_01035 [Candidatus Dependentiae bacterium]|nr:hypothetical protein [Candidatus Dependentiae bacterium]
MTFLAYMRAWLFFLVFGSVLCAESKLYVAWTEFDAFAAVYLEKGMKRDQILEDALILSANDELGAKAANVFLELFDSALGYMRRNSEFKVSEQIVEIRDFIFKVVNKHGVIKQKLALEIFKEYKKWDLVISDHGTVASLNVYTLMHFIKSLELFFAEVTAKGTRFAKPDHLVGFAKRIAEITPVFTMSKTQFMAKKVYSSVEASAQVAKSMVLAGCDAGLAVGHKSLVFGKNTLDRGMDRVSSIGQRFSVDKAITYAGSLSAVGLFVGLMYVVHNRKEVARNLFMHAGGRVESIKKIISLYSEPKARWDKLKTWLRAWSYDDASFRSNRAQELTGFVKPKTLSTSGMTDPLSAVLLHFARNPELVDPEKAEELSQEMANEIAYRQYEKDKANGKRLMYSEIADVFRKAANKYRSAVGDKRFCGSTPKLAVDSQDEFDRVQLEVTVKALWKSIFGKLDTIQKRLKLKESEYKFKAYKTTVMATYVQSPAVKEPSQFLSYINHLQSLDSELSTVLKTPVDNMKNIFNQFAIANMNYHGSKVSQVTATVPMGVLVPTAPSAVGQPVQGATAPALAAPVQIPVGLAVAPESWGSWLVRKATFGRLKVA